MNPLDRLAVRLSLTRAEISIVSLLVVFLVLGGAVRNFRSARDASAVLKEKQEEELSDREADSMLAIASAFPAVRTDKRSEGMLETTDHTDDPIGSAESDEKQPRERKRSSRAEKKVFNGTIPFNKATEQQLQRIPGVGPVMAKRLVAFRSAKGGRIERHEDLLEVKGIGEKKLEVLKRHLTLE